MTLRAVPGRRVALVSTALKIWMLWTPMAEAGGCAENHVDVRSESGVSRFVVEIADDPAERSRGLMYRAAMDEGAGMLFLFDRPEPASFWMKNTPLPLDIIFVDERGVVDSIAAETTPFSETPLNSAGPVVAVLEINAGLAARFGIGIGAELRHPAFKGENSAWPCE